MSRILSAVFLSMLCLPVALKGADPELVNYRSGISLTWSGTPGTDYQEEYFYHDKMLWDFKVVYIKSTTDISMALNQFSKHADGTICYRVDRDLNYNVNWHNRTYHKAYTAPFSFADLAYEDGAPVTGTTGPKPGFAVTDRSDYYYRGVTDSAGDEWHTITVAHDISDQETNNEYNVTDGKMFCFVVNPKTPCLTVRAVGDGQFYTTPPKFYFLPRIHNQTTYFTDSCTFEIKDINGNDVLYRINGGSWVQGTNPVLDQDDFKTGSNTLEYYYAGNQAYTKIRTVVKDPTWPSAGETHGSLLWGTQANYDKFLNRIENEPMMSSWWGKMKDETFYNQTLSTFAISGGRQNTAKGLLPCVLLAKVHGLAAKRSSALSRTFVQFAREFLMTPLTRIDPVGLEQHHNGESIPSREIKDRGYYTVGRRSYFMNVPFAYDIMIDMYRSDKDPDGITPIEDYYLRDMMARWVMFNATELGGYCANVPGMWGKCRMIGGQFITLAMPSYSTPYFGTSGMDGNTTVYKDLPFPSRGYTWKELFIDETNETPGYPDPVYTADFDRQWSGPGAYTAGGELLVGQGAWGDRMTYHRLCSEVFGGLAMMAALHTGKDYPNFFTGISRAQTGDLYCLKKLSGDDIGAYGPVWGDLPFADNAYYGTFARQHLDYAAANSREGDYMKYGFPYVFFWYERDYDGIPAGGPDTTAPAVHAVEPTDDPAVIAVTFTEAVDPATTENSDNYFVSDGVTVDSVRLRTDKRSVAITVSGLVIRENYSITVAGVRDLADPANTMTAETMVFTAKNIFDDAEPAASTIGSWTASTYTAGYYGTGYRHDGNTDKGTKSFTFSFTALGSCEVFTRAPADDNRASNVPVDIIGTDSVTVQVNQRTNSNTWVSLGVHAFDGPGAVRLRNDGTNGYVVADAVKVVWTGGAGASTVAEGTFNGDGILPGIAVFPNPSCGPIRVIGIAAPVLVYDHAGRLVTRTDNQTAVLSPGLYLVTDEARTAVERVMVVR